MNRKNPRYIMNKADNQNSTYRHFWAKGFFVSTVGLNTKVVEDYIRNQEKEDMVQDNLSTKEHVDPFKG
ncbi:hypothetical protein EUX50_08910 [Haemophilus haemolyticus]|uniref:Transposase IS200-like domain-containing protein n=1 Tax=Haemophilus haemolyticus TaxID=726 RepID=A0ABY2YM12_HAEHA|nr:hypothetical protein EUX50_08910 [Haemophilus haemolyticus]